MVLRGKYLCLLLFLAGFANVPAQEMWRHAMDRTLESQYEIPIDSTAFSLEEISKNPGNYSQLILRRLDFDEQQAQIISRAVSLRALVFDLNEEITSEDTVALASLLSSCRDLRFLVNLSIHNYYANSDMHKMVVPTSVVQLRHLNHLDIVANIRYIPASLFGCKELKRLEISAGFLSDIPNDFAKLDRLEELWIYSDVLAALPNSLGSCPRLKYLSIDCTSLQQLSGNFPSLDTLELFSAQLKKVDFNNAQCEYYLHGISQDSFTMFVPFNVNLKMYSSGPFEFYFSSYLSQLGFGLNILFRDTTATIITFDKIRIPHLDYLGITWASHIEMILIKDDSTNLRDLKRLRVTDALRLKSIGGLENYCSDQLRLENFNSFSFTNILREITGSEKFDTLIVNENALSPIPKNIKRIKGIQVLQIYNAYPETSKALSSSERNKLRRKLRRVIIEFPKYPH